jgi:ribosomal protein L21E
MRMDDLKTRTIYVKFDLGDIVYLKITPEQYKGMVTGISVRPTGNCYSVTWEDGHESTHYDLELTTEFIPDYSRKNAEEDD